MLDQAVHQDRRRRLSAAVDGPVLLLGHGTRARNLPMNALPFRQDSTFLYLTGCDLPDAAALIDGGRLTLFLPEPADDDALWHGHVDRLEDLGARYGADDVRPFDPAALAQLAPGARTLAVADASRDAWLTAWTGRPHRFGKQHGDADLVRAIIALRRTKSAVELDELRRISALSAEAHALIMRLTRPGVHEQSLAALFNAFMDARGLSLGYQIILTQRGEVLHNHDHDARLEAGRLLLLDAGGELRTGYGADITRTWPVSGAFTPRQRAAYDAVLEAQRVSIDLCRPGVRYREVHDASCRVLAQFLLDEGLLRDISVDDAVATGAHALFFPHGVGHLLGMDVHDLEAFGDLPAYPPGASRPPQFGTAYLRLDLPLEPGWIVTVEPGFYVVPAILDDPTLRERFRHVTNPSAWEAWAGFGGIRIEDDVAITDGAPEVLTDGAPKDPDKMCALIGTGANLEAWLP
jgi:Xaa-Pro aminopeptidase